MKPFTTQATEFGSTMDGLRPTLPQAPAASFGISGSTSSVGPVLSVGQVVARIRGVIEQHFPGPVWIEGELSNCSFPASGHIYFSLVDEKLTDRFGQRLVLPCAFYRGANLSLKFSLNDGLKVLCLGQVTTYERQGQYQLRVLRVEPKGKGALQLAFEQLKKRLSAEGLFDEARKRPIPVFPSRIGLISSATGSAIHDLVSKLRGVFDVVVLPVRVQGDGAASDIVGAIELANRLHLADVLVVGRGGGSIEDLWAFNEEPVARAIARSRIPVISAVGHQDDWTIADYVADLRASTPTDAAKGLVYRRQELENSATRMVESLLEAMEAYLQDQSYRIANLSSSLRLLHPMNHLQQCESHSTEMLMQMINTTRHAIDAHERNLQGLSGRLQALSPLAVLARGYSITRKLPESRVITRAGALRTGDKIETLLAEGRVLSQVTGISSEKKEDVQGSGFEVQGS